MGMWGKRDDMVVHGREPFNAEPPGAALAGARVTPVDTFYSRSHGPVPRLDPADWRLTVDGLVAHPLRLSLAELRDRFEETGATVTLQCAGNRRAGLMSVRDIPGETPWGPGAASTARFHGVRLADVLAHAGVAPEAAHIAFHAPDVSPSADPPQPYDVSVPRERATEPDVLLAWAMNDVPLPEVHGAPLRVVVPGWIGARSVKWLTRVTARATPSDGWFQTTAYRLPPAEAGAEGVTLGPFPLNCAVLTPQDGALVPRGPVEVTGYALAGQGRAVARVEVSTDGGRAWSRAALDEPAGPGAWQQWHITLDLPSGDADVLARAWDTSGAGMPASPAASWNPKGYVNTSWPRVRLRVR
ncbi:sulfite oxidase [Streptomyces sp. Vc74B-19]|uniref:sulfite oxidase n=1 Tax=Streptomyces sp. Vc74B-19 TaxID=2741324 RepID=UPI001BFBFC49|nr:sulfite oxidase [Streptomyces sp. Vc74B-19]MBT3163882.1 sulfite oxidase [Streptomyces sp. Vc74B-19]